MRERGQVWRVGKWAGLVLCLPILVTWTWCCSARPLTVAFKPAYGRTQFTFGAGSIICITPTTIRGPRASFDVGCGIDGIGQTGLLWPLVWALPGGSWAIGIPLWMAFFALAIPTALLWYREHRFIPPGHCGRCGYDLTKNESGVCPECGVVIDGQTNQPVSPGAHREEPSGRGGVKARRARGGWFRWC